MNNALVTVKDPICNIGSAYVISEKKYRFLVEGTNDCILSFDSNLNITTANRAAYEQLAVRRGLESATSFYDLVYFAEGESDLTLQIIKEKINMLLPREIPSI